MSRAVEKIHAILDRFRLREPVPADIRMFVAATKRDSAVRVLRHHGVYGAAFGAALILFHGARRLGIRLAMRQARIALAGIVMIALTLIIIIFAIIFNSTDVYNRINNIDGALHDDIHGRRVPGKSDPVPSRDEGGKQHPEKTLPGASVHCRLGVELFTGGALGAEETRRVTGLVARELILLRGAEKVVLLPGAGRKKIANLALLGGVEKLGGAYIITAKIVDMQTGRVTSSFVESADSASGVDDACRRLAAKAAEKVD